MLETSAEIFARLTFFALRAFAVMILIGILHSELPVVPAISIYASIWITVLADILLAGQLVMKRV